MTNLFHRICCWAIYNSILEQMALSKTTNSLRHRKLKQQIKKLDAQ